MTTTDHETTTTSPARRSVLKALGVGTGAVALGGRARASGGDRTLSVEHVCYGDVEYTICVTGAIHKGADADDGDDIDSHGDETCVSGNMGPDRGFDDFTFSGSLADVTVTGPGLVRVDGDAVYVPDCANDHDDCDCAESKPSFPSTVRFECVGDDRPTIYFAPQGRILLPDGNTTGRVSATIQRMAGDDDATAVELQYSGAVASFYTTHDDVDVTFTQRVEG